MYWKITFDLLLLFLFQSDFQKYFDLLCKNVLWMPMPTLLLWAVHSQTVMGPYLFNRETVIFCCLVGAIIIFGLWNLTLRSFQIIIIMKIWCSASSRISSRRLEVNKDHLILKTNVFSNAAIFMNFYLSTEAICQLRLLLVVLMLVFTHRFDCTCSHGTLQVERCTMQMVYGGT